MDKNLGQVFTPPWIVNLILDQINYFGESILNKNIIEPSFGDGAFLLIVVERYITAAEQHGWTKKAIKQGLEQYIHGIEIDTQYFNETIRRLNQLAYEHNLPSVVWSLYNNNSLKVDFFDGQMDFVVGNPPYVRIHNLDSESRDLVKQKFSFCKKGNIDLYIAFYELGIKMLNATGRLGLITPNSFMKNTSCREFRNYFVENLYLSKLINFGSKRIFNASTYTSIIILDKSPENMSNPMFEYYTYEDVLHLESFIDINSFKDKAWNFQDEEKMEFLNQCTNPPEEAIGLKYEVQYGITTLRDKIFIAKSVSATEDDNIVIFNGSPVEKEILRDIVKGSTYNNDGVYNKIIFPYIKEDNRWIVLAEEVFMEKYPLAYNYLNQHKEELLKRDIEKSLKWYAYGRSQGLKNLDKEKVVVKQLFHPEMYENLEVSIVPSNVLVYAGIYITGSDLSHVHEVLTSKKFLKYASMVGKDMSGGYKAINTKNIKSFCYERANH